jgi:hypothetical protein
MRYVVRFTNGYWRVLDLHEYVEVGMFGMKKTADQAAEEFNLEEFAVPAHRVIARASR